MSVCPSVCLHGTTRLPLEGFSRNLIFEDFSKIVEEVQISRKPINLTGALHEYLCTVHSEDISLDSS